MAIRIRKKSKSPAGAIVAIMAGGVVAAGIMLTPANLIEMAATASGLPAILPAAAPPLGEKARLILAFTSGISSIMLAAGLYALAGRIIRRQGTSAIRIGYDIGYAEDADEPVFRLASFNNDAEPRRPLFASSELSGVTPLMATGTTAGDEGLRLPIVPEPLDETELELDAAMVVVHEPVAASHIPFPDEASPVEDPAGIVASLRAEPGDYTALSITDLVARFERGLNHRRAMVADAVTARKAEEAQAQARAAWLEPAQIAPTPQAEPERKSIDAEVDEALRAALGTLQKMTARAA